MSCGKITVPMWMYEEEFIKFYLMKMTRGLIFIQS